jgi:alpha-glucosidase
VQNGIFQPRFSIHSCNTDNTVTEPWMYSEHTNLIRNAIKFRYQLMPYLYSLLREASLRGLPMMRPTFYEFQHDCNTYNQGVDFMLGSSLLVANVVEENACERQIYLPDGCTWYDFYTFKAYSGGQTIIVPVDLSSIPLFIRDNAIIALTENKYRLTSGSFQQIQLIIGGESNKFELYQDDGLSEEFRNGNYLQTEICVNKHAEQTLINFTHRGNFKSESEQLTLEVINQQKGPFWVSVGERKIQQFLHRDKFAESQEGWYYSTTKGAVEIKTSFPAVDCQIVVSFAHFDLIGM